MQSSELSRMPVHVQFYGSNEDTDTVFFGDASSKKFGTYFVKDGKVSCTQQEEPTHAPILVSGHPFLGWTIELCCHES